MIKNRGLPYNVYSILYDSCVTSISDYASEITGHTQYDHSVQLQTRAIRAFLGLPKNSCNMGVLSEVDWLLPEYRTRLKMVRQYSRLVRMENERLTKKVYLWDRSLNNGNVISSWSSEVKNTFYTCGLNGIFDANTSFSVKRTIQTIKEKFLQDQVEYLRLECEQQPKLRTVDKAIYAPI